MKVLKKLAFAFAIFFINIGLSFAASVDVKIAPFANYKNNERAEDKLKINEKLTQELQKFYFDGLIYFSSIKEKDAGVILSSLDAAKLCNVKKIDYLIFGFISSTDKSISAELKLYDYEGKKIARTFYVQDEISETQRFIETLQNRIVQYFCDETGVQAIAIEDVPKKTEFFIPFDVGVWNFLQSGWNSHFTEIVKVRSGLEIRPSAFENVIFNREFFLSFGTEIAFKYASGNQDYYAGNYYSFEISLPFCVNFSVSEKNKIAVGVGPLFEFNLMQINQKYEDPMTKFGNEIGAMYKVKFIHKLSEKIDLLTDCTGSVFFYKTAPSWISINLGVRVKV